LHGFCFAAKVRKFFALYDYFSFGEVLASKIQKQVKRYNSDLKKHLFRNRNI